MKSNIPPSYSFSKSNDRPKTAPEKNIRNLGSLSHFLKPGSLRSPNIEEFPKSGINEVVIDAFTETLQSYPNSRKKSRFCGTKYLLPPTDFHYLHADNTNQSNQDFEEFWQSEKSLPNQLKHSDFRILEEEIKSRKYFLMDDNADRRTSDKNNTNLMMQPKSKPMPAKMKQRSPDDDDRRIMLNKYANKHEQLSNKRSSPNIPSVLQSMMTDHKINNETRQGPLSPEEELYDNNIISRTKETTERFKAINENILRLESPSFSYSSSNFDPNNSLYSPRSTYMKESILRHQLPFAIRGLATGESIEVIDIHDMGLGDDKGCCLAAAVALCPRLTSVNISGNRLTDVSIQPLLKEILEKTQCRYLDLSANKIDNLSIDTLKKNLQHHRCKLEELRLRQSDIDDNECAELLATMVDNRSVTLLDLSHNLIGESEDYNTVHPSFVTGGEAIADFLTQNRTIRELDLSWNKVRRDTAMTLVRSFPQNDSLMVLKLAYNNIGDKAAQYLAHSLRVNHTLTSIDISYNNIRPQAAIVFAHVLLSNESMMELNLSGSCVGEAGIQALLRTMRRVACQSRQLRISFDNANLFYKDPLVFQHSHPAGKYDLQLSDPYDYAVACNLLETANTKPAANFKDIKYARESTQSGTAYNNNIIHSSNANITMNNSRSNNALTTSMTTSSLINNNDMLNDLTIARAQQSSQSSMGSWKPLLESLSSCMEEEVKDRHEKKDHNINGRLKTFYAIQRICEKLGYNPSEILIERIKIGLRGLGVSVRGKLHLVVKVILKETFGMGSYWDSRGTQPEYINDHELAKRLEALGVYRESEDVRLSSHDSESVSPPVDFLQSAKNIIRSIDFTGSGLINEGAFVRFLTTTLVDSLPRSPTVLIDSRSQSIWNIPTHGRLVFDFDYQEMLPVKEELQSRETFEIFMTSIASTCSKSDPGNIDILSAMLVDRDFFVNYEVATLLYHKLQDSKKPPRECLQVFLSHLSGPFDACRFLTQNLTFSEIVQLRSVSGSLFSVATGLCSGHHVLDMNRFDDRQALIRLNAYNNYEKLRNQSDCPLRNTSQSGDWNNYRNTSINGKYCALDSRWFNPTCLPLIGKIRFDYISTSRPATGVDAVTETRLNEIIKAVFLEEPTVETVQPPSSNSSMLHGSSPTNSKKSELSSIAMGKRTTGSGGRKRLMNALRQSSSANKSLSTISSQDSESDLSVDRMASSGDRDGEKEGEIGEINRTKSGRLLQYKNSKRKGSIGSNELNTTNNPKKSLSIRERDKSRDMLVRIKPDRKKEAAVVAKNTTAKSLPDEKEDCNAKSIKNYWNDYIDTSAAGYTFSHVKFLLDKFQSAQKAVRPISKRTGSSKDIEGDVKDKTALDFKDTDSGNRGLVLTNIPKSVTDDVIQLEQQSMVVRKCANYEKCLLVLECLLVYNLYLTVAQVTKIISEFKRRNAPDSIIERVICICHSRIVNLDELPLLLGTLTQSQRKELFHRLGILNLWNPIYPDGSFELDLSAYDQREAAKILIKLSDSESGQNRLEEYFGNSLIEHPLPGWELPLSWVAADVAGDTECGPKRHGTYRLLFTSVGVGCVPQRALRQQLYSLRTLAGSRGSYVRCRTGSKYPGGKSRYGSTISSGKKPESSGSLRLSSVEWKESSLMSSSSSVLTSTAERAVDDIISLESMNLNKNRRQSTDLMSVSMRSIK